MHASRSISTPQRRAILKSIRSNLMAPCTFGRRRREWSGALMIANIVDCRKKSISWTVYIWKFSLWNISQEKNIQKLFLKVWKMFHTNEDEWTKRENLRCFCFKTLCWKNFLLLHHASPPFVVFAQIWWARMRREKSCTAKYNKQTAPQTPPSSSHSPRVISCSLCIDFHNSGWQKQ